jgi:hypothetical protein
MLKEWPDRVNITDRLWKLKNSKPIFAPALFRGVVGALWRAIWVAGQDATGNDDRRGPDAEHRMDQRRKGAREPARGGVFK